MGDIEVIEQTSEELLIQQPNRDSLSTYQLPDNPEFRKQVLDFQDALMLYEHSWKGEELDKHCPLIHTFTEGAYARQMLIPAGTVIVGKIHKHAHFNIILSGEASVATEEGIKKIIGPCLFVSAPRTKRVVYANTDTVWVTIHVTDKTDLSEIEEEIIAKDYGELGFDDPLIKKLGEIT